MRMQLQLGKRPPVRWEGRERGAASAAAAMLSQSSLLHEQLGGLRLMNGGNGKGKGKGKGKGGKGWQGRSKGKGKGKGKGRR